MPWHVKDHVTWVKILLGVLSKFAKFKIPTELTKIRPNINDHLRRQCFNSRNLIFSLITYVRNCEWMSANRITLTGIFLQKTHATFVSVWTPFNFWNAMGYVVKIFFKSIWFDKISLKDVQIRLNWTVPRMNCH